MSPNGAASRCLTCGAAAVDPILDFGPQPPSNRFCAREPFDVDRHDLVLGVCSACGQIQLIDPMPPAMVKSRFDWISYAEPERHLDSVADRLAGIVTLPGPLSALGFSYKDASFIERLRVRGCATVQCIDPAKHLGMTDRFAGLETRQEIASCESFSALSAKLGHHDIVIVRHVLEHAHDPNQFLHAIKDFVRPDGVVMFEIPDCTKFVAACDYPFVWEEHVTYFDRRTLSNTLTRAGFEPIDIFSCPFALEDSLIAFCRIGTPSDCEWAVDPIDFSHVRRFGEAFAATRQSIQRRFEELRRNHRRIAMLGAGHHGVRFINFFDVGKYLDYVIDDNPRKRGLRLPGSGLEIVGSGALDSTDICLLSLSPESESAVVQRNARFVARGGVFASIFRLSPLSLLAEN